MVRTDVCRSLLLQLSVLVNTLRRIAPRIASGPRFGAVSLTQCVLFPSTVLRPHLCSRSVRAGRPSAGGCKHANWASKDLRPKMLRALQCYLTNVYIARQFNDAVMFRQMRSWRTTHGTSALHQLLPYIIMEEHGQLKHSGVWRTGMVIGSTGRLHAHLHDEGAAHLMCQRTNTMR
jgi:hypothetical protein